MSLTPSDCTARAAHSSCSSSHLDSQASICSQLDCSTQEADGVRAVAAASCLHTAPCCLLPELQCPTGPGGTN